MQYKSPTDHHHLLLLLLLLCLLPIFAYLPLTMADSVKLGASIKAGSNVRLVDDIEMDISDDAADEDQQTYNKVNAGEQSAGKNNKQSCEAELQCQLCLPSTCECPSTLESEVFKQVLKDNLGPVIRQRLIELKEKTQTVESSIEVADQTINMLKLLKESDSEFIVVRNNIISGARQLKDAFQKLEYEMHNVC